METVTTCVWNGRIAIQEKLKIRRAYFILLYSMRDHRGGSVGVVKVAAEHQIRKNVMRQPE